MLPHGTHRSGMVGLAPKCVRLTPNGTNSGLYQIRFQCIWRRGAKCTDIWSEKALDLSHLGPIWPTLEPNLPSLNREKEYSELLTKDVKLGEQRTKWEQSGILKYHMSYNLWLTDTKCKTWTHICPIWWDYDPLLASLIHLTWATIMVG